MGESCFCHLRTRLVVTGENICVGIGVHMVPKCHTVSGFHARTTQQFVAKVFLCRALHNQHRLGLQFYVDSLACGLERRRIRLDACESNGPRGP